MNRALLQRRRRRRVDRGGRQAHSSASWRARGRPRAIVDHRRRCGRARRHADLLPGPRRQAVLFADARKTPDGRDYRAVPAGADVSFDSEDSGDAVTDGSGIRAKDQILSESDGPSGHVTDAEEGTRWGWTISPFTKARTPTTGPSSCRPGRFSERARNPNRSCGAPSSR